MSMLDLPDPCGPAAIHWYQRGDVSQEKAAHIAGLNRINSLEISKPRNRCLRRRLAELDRELQRDDSSGG